MFRMGMENGYVKLYRSIRQSDFMRDHTLGIVWIWCLTSAGYKERTIWEGNTEVMLKPGQFIYSRERAAAELGIGVQKFRDKIGLLIRRKSITSTSTSKFTIVTICNWESYQNRDDVNNQQDNQQDNQHLTSVQPAFNHKQESKECKEGKEVMLNDKISCAFPDKKPSVPARRREYSKSFEMFWKEYPRQVGKGKAFDEWKKIGMIHDGTTAEQIIEAVVKQKRAKHLRVDEPQYIPNPATWLHQRRWEDTVKEVKPSDPTGSRRIIR